MPSEFAVNDPPGSTRNCREFFSRFTVEYSDSNDFPAGCVQEIQGRSSDINDGMSGKYVWLRAHHADSPRDMVDYIWVLITDDSSRSDEDLAKGTGGQYRYLDVSRNMSCDRYVTEVGLWRTDDAQDGVPSDWDGKTSDLNQGRGGSFLYLVWRKKLYIGPK